MYLVFKHIMLKAIKWQVNIGNKMYKNVLKLKKDLSKFSMEIKKIYKGYAIYIFDRGLLNSMFMFW